MTVRIGNHLCSVRMATPTRRVIHSGGSLVLSNDNHQEVEMAPMKNGKSEVVSKPKITLQQVGDLQWLTIALPSNVHVWHDN